MQPIVTKLTKLLNIKSPIIAAPMYFASTPDLAAAVSGAGGLGMIAAGFSSSEQLKGELRSMRSSLNLADGVPLPIGVGFLGWILDKTETSDDPRIPSVLSEMPASVWFAYGIDLGKYIAKVRNYDAQRKHKTIIFVVTNSVKDALRAANEWNVDVVVAQGIEAGGHGHSKAPSLSNLLQAVLIAIPNGPAIVAAGGVSTGAQVAALLTMGAHGVALGTRFLYTHECMYPDLFKSILVESDLNSTTRGYMFDEVNRLPIKVEWPSGVDGRAIANRIVDDAAEGLSIEERTIRVEEGKANGEKDRLVIWAGDSVGIIKEIKNTADVFHELHNDAVASLKRASLILG